MPKGVEHLPLSQVQQQKDLVPTTVMPKGVEHFLYRGAAVAAPACRPQ